MGHTDQPLWRRAATHTLHASFLMKARIEEALQAEVGLLLADHEALINIDHAEEPLRMTDIAHRLILSPGGTTKVIDRLEALGYVAREPDSTDRRATIVKLTAKGESILIDTRRILDAKLEKSWAVHVSDAEAKVIVTAMARVLGDHHA